MVLLARQLVVEVLIKNRCNLIEVLLPLSIRRWGDLGVDYGCLLNTEVCVGTVHLFIVPPLTWAAWPTTLPGVRRMAAVDTLLTAHGIWYPLSCLLC